KISFIAARIVRPLMMTSSMRIISRPSVSNGRLEGLTFGLRPIRLKSSREKEISSSPKGSARPRRLLMTSASQTPPVRIPISAGLSTPRWPRTRRNPVSSSSSNWLISSNAVINASSVRSAGLFPAPGFQYQHCSQVIDTMATEIPAASGGHHFSFGLKTGEPFIHHFHRYMITAVQALTEFSGPGTHIILSAIHVQRQPYQHQLRLRLCQQFFNVVPVRNTVAGGNHGQRPSRTQQ